MSIRAASENGTVGSKHFTDFGGQAILIEHSRSGRGSFCKKGYGAIQMWNVECACLR